MLRVTSGQNPSRRQSVETRFDFMSSFQLLQKKFNLISTSLIHLYAQGNFPDLVHFKTKYKTNHGKTTAPVRITSLSA